MEHLTKSFADMNNYVEQRWANWPDFLTPFPINLWSDLFLRQLYVILHIRDRAADMREKERKQRRKERKERELRETYDQEVKYGMKTQEKSWLLWPSLR